MGKEMIFFRDSCTRVKDLERENKELVKQGSIDKKTLIALREVRIQFDLIHASSVNVLRKSFLPVSYGGLQASQKVILQTENVDGS